MLYRWWIFQSLRFFLPRAKAGRGKNGQKFIKFFTLYSTRPDANQDLIFIDLLSLSRHPGTSTHCCTFPFKAELDGFGRKSLKRPVRKAIRREQGSQETENKTTSKGICRGHRHPVHEKWFQETTQAQYLHEKRTTRVVASFRECFFTNSRVDFQSVFELKRCRENESSFRSVVTLMD